MFSAVDIKSFALYLRNTKNPGSLSNYIKWRFTEQFFYNLAKDRKGNEIPNMPQLDSNWVKKTKLYIDTLSEDESHKILTILPIEANYYEYEDIDCEQADKMTLRDTIVKSRSIFNGEITTETKWVILGFRRHLVSAHFKNNKITIYNSATIDFMIDTLMTESNKHKLIRYYEDKWRYMVTKIWPVSYTDITIIHMDCQGYNDCCIWCWVFPILKEHELNSLKKSRGNKYADSYLKILLSMDRY